MMSGERERLKREQEWAKGIKEGWKTRERVREWVSEDKERRKKKEERRKKKEERKKEGRRKASAKE
jgi:hypothetical protein